MAVQEIAFSEDLLTRVAGVDSGSLADERFPDIKVTRAEKQRVRYAALSNNTTQYTYLL